MAGMEFDDDWEADAVRPEPTPQRVANLQFFLATQAGAARRYRLNRASLTRRAGQVRPASGSTARGQFPYRCAHALAARLGVQVTEFPGAHAGFVSHPRAFAEQLRQLLGT